MMDIEQELERLIEKYKVDKHYPAYRTSRRACAYINKWIRDLSNAEKTVLFISMDERALHLIRNWSTGNNISTLQISSVKELSEHMEKMQNTDKIYIVSYSKTIEILHWLWRHNFQAESVYDMLENQHIYLQMEFHRFFSPIKISDELDLENQYLEHSCDGSSFVLYEYYYQKQRLLHFQSEQDCERIREKLFFLSLCMKNFVEAKRILETMSNSVCYKKCWRDIEKLLHKIEVAMRINKQKHIIIYWLDGLNYQSAQEMGFFLERSDHSICFSNAFTVTPFTYPTLRNMFCNIRQVDDLGYRLRHIGVDNSPLLQDIINHGYDFSVLGGTLGRLFDAKYNHNGESRTDAPCSEVFWNLADQIMRSKQPTVYLAHALIEIHTPRLSVQRNRFEKEYVIKASRDQLKELNLQLSFYDNILGDNFYRIYMGDHGFINRNDVINSSLHIPLQIYHSTWKKQIWNKLFCFLDFPILMHQLLIGEDLNEMLWDREFVPVQDVAEYNADFIKKFFLARNHDLLFFGAYKGVVTSDYIYLHFKTGEEIFHKWADGLYIPSLDLNNSHENPELFKDLRKKAGKFPEELDSAPEFRYAEDMYTAYENVKKTVKKAVKLLNDKFIEYPDCSIALRSGGYHTLWLWSMLTASNRKKIGGIIDNNPRCVCKDLGYSIYSTKDCLPDTFKAVLLSSYGDLEALKAEAEKIYTDFEIINIYQYWKAGGYDFKGDFWNGLKEDWILHF